MLTIAVIGSGPTGIYTVKYLLERCADISITLFEEQAQAGKGTPYHQDWNDAEMLANIASIEIPPIHETLEEWLNSQSEYELGDIGIAREDISDRAFYPRVALGEYFASQLQILARSAQNSGNELHLYTNCKVVDVALGNDRVVVFAQPEKDTVKEHRFDYAVMATGHTWPKESEVRPGYFLSPWPAQALKTIGNCHVGIRGTSLSAIDAAVALSVARGMFERNAEGKLIYLSEPGTDDFHITMMSRKGILPEADFYHPIPYEPLSKCTAEAIAELIKQVPGEELLSAVFALFKRELALCDPHYAAAIGIESLTQETFASAYFSERERYDAFDWARHNLEEAKRHQEIEYTVPWRYAILRMHEPIGQIVPHLMAEGHKQFQKYLKSVFVDNYATVPHESIERMLALHEAGKLDVLQLGKVYENRHESARRRRAGNAARQTNPLSGLHRSPGATAVILT